MQHRTFPFHFTIGHTVELPSKVSSVPLSGSSANGPKIRPNGKSMIPKITPNTHTNTSANIDITIRNTTNTATNMETTNTVVAIPTPARPKITIRSFIPPFSSLLSVSSPASSILSAVLWACRELRPQPKMLEMNYNSIIINDQLF